MHPQHVSFHRVLQEAAMYDQIAQYYKYIDPEKHIYYYQLHYQCMRKVMCAQPPLLRNDNPNQNALAKIRVLHASPDAPTVDIYINDQKAIERVKYYMLTPYNELPAGSYKIEVYPTGQKGRPVLSQNIRIEPGKNYTVAAAGMLNELQLVAAEDQEKDPARAKVRFWHLSPNTPSVDIATKNGEILFRNVSFKEATNYLELAPTTADIEVRLTGTDQVALTLFNTNLKANEVYTIVAMGLVDKSPRLEAVIIQP